MSEAARIEREMRALEAAMLASAPEHPWIPLFLIVVRSQYYYISQSRLGHRATWDVILPSAQMLETLNKKVKTELFTAEAAEDENSVVHKILLANIGQKKIIDGKSYFVTLLQDSNNTRIKYLMDTISTQPGRHPDHIILGIKSNKHTHQLINNVTIRTYALSGLLGPKDLISQIKR